MEIQKLLRLESTEQDKIEMIISNNFDLMYKGKAAVTIDKWDNLVNEILAWRDYENKKLILKDVVSSGDINLVVFENYTRCYKVSDKELKQLKKDNDIEEGDIVCKASIIKKY